MLEILFTIIFLVIFQAFDLSTNLQIILIIVYLFVMIPSFYTYIKGPPFVPSNSSTIQAAIQLAQISKSDIVYDLGCGDGRFLIQASSLCKQAIGYETSFLTFLLAKFNTRKYSNIQIIFANFWKADLSQANIIFCFLLKPLMSGVEKNIWPNLKPKTKLISNTFKLPNIQPNQITKNVYLYTK